MLFFLFWRYRHFPSFLYLIKKCLEEIMALLHNSGKMLKSWHTCVFQKFYKKRWYTKSTDTHIQIQKTIFLSPFRLYETLKWKTVKAMKRLRFFKISKNSEAVQLMPFSPRKRLFQRSLKAAMPPAKYELCTHKNTLSHSSINLA